MSNERTDPAPASSLPHPMIAVPDAIRIILRETARLVVTQRRTAATTTMTKEVSELVSTDYLVGQRFGPWILAEPVTMKEPGYPPYRASIMDGYAISVEATHRAAQQQEQKSNDIDPPWTHIVADRLYAGAARPSHHTATTTVEQNAESSLPVAYYITTGAAVPESCDCVVPVEDCKVSSQLEDGQRVSIPLNSCVTDKWIRKIGCDIPPGTMVLPAGHVLDGVAVGLLLQAGVSHVTVRRPVTVGVLSTGNELLSPHEWQHGAASNSPQNMIPDVNRPCLLSLLSHLKNANHDDEQNDSGVVPICSLIDLGQVRDDDADGLTRLLQTALESCDVIVTTGGISEGETDILEQVLVQRLGGQLHFGRIHMKPGKPSTFVTVPNSTQQTRLVFALPGNPVSGTVCCHLLVRPCLNLLWTGADNHCSAENIPQEQSSLLDDYLEHMVANAFVPPEVPAILAQDVKLDVERPEYHRVVLKHLTPQLVSAMSKHDQQDDEKVQYEAHSTGIQQSSRLMSMRDAHGLLLLPQATPTKPKALAGERYTAILLTDHVPCLRERYKPIRLSNSKHIGGGTSLKKKRRDRSFKVCMTVVDRNGNVENQQDEQDNKMLHDLSDRVQNAMSGSRSGSVSVLSSNIYRGSVDGLYDHLVSRTNKETDIHVVVYSKFHQSLHSSLAFSKALSSNLTKLAPAMALQARQGAAAQDTTAALFEVVVGYMPPKESDGSSINTAANGSMVIHLPEEGLDGGLDNVRGLLKHAIEIARGG